MSSNVLRKTCSSSWTLGLCPHIWSADLDAHPLLGSLYSCLFLNCFWRQSSKLKPSHYASFLPVFSTLVHMSKLPWDILEQITAGVLSCPQWETFLSCLNIWGDYTNNKSVMNECLKDIKRFYQWLTKFATKFRSFTHDFFKNRILCFYADRIGNLFSWVWLSVVSPEKRTQKEIFYNFFYFIFFRK